MASLINASAAVVMAPMVSTASNMGGGQKLGGRAVANRIRYSKKIPGAAGNWGWPIRFDCADCPAGYVSITQYKGNNDVGRVLLSPAQLRALVAFMAPRRASRG